MEIAALILAAGAGRRMGGRPKATLPLGRGTFLERIVATARAAGAGAIVVVRGKADPGAPAGVAVVRNLAPEQGMLSSIHVGLRALPAGVAGALLWPVDCPRVREADVRAILERAAGGGALVLPRHGARRGHPAWFASRLFPELLAAPLDVGARAVVRAHAAEVVEVEAGPEVLDDVDTPEDLERIRDSRP